MVYVQRQRDVLAIKDTNLINTITTSVIQSAPKNVLMVFVQSQKSVLATVDTSMTDLITVVNQFVLKVVMMFIVQSKESVLATLVMTNTIVYQFALKHAAMEHVPLQTNVLAMMGTYLM